MDVFKLTMESSEIHDITNRQDFEALTAKKKPWVDYEFTTMGRRTRHFAVCPHCNNAIVMIGFNDGSKIKTPYGRHYLARELWQLGSVRDPEAYEVCPYHMKGQSTLNKDEKFPRISEQSIKLVSKLIEHFDSVIHLIQMRAGVQFSKNCIIKMLTAYQASEGWLYKGASEQNIPWTFAYLTLSESLYGQRIYRNEIRQALLCKNPHLTFEQYRLIPTTGVFFSAEFCFLNHQRKVVNHHLTESLTFSISTSDREVLYQNDITWELTDFDAHIERGIEERRPDLVVLAEQHLGYLIR